MLSTKYNRRQFLQSAAKAAAGSLALGMAPGLLGDDIKPPHILLIYCSGGWDQTMIFDGKIGVNDVAQEPQATNGRVAKAPLFIDHPNRPAVRKFFETFGANATIVNGVSSGSLTRDAALKYMLSAIPKNRKRPVDWLTFYASSLAPVIDLPHVVIEAPFIPGELGAAAVKLNRSALTSPNPSDATLSAKEEAALSTFYNSVYFPYATSLGSNSNDASKTMALYRSQIREPIVRSRIQTIINDLGSSNGESHLLREGKVAIELFARAYSQCVTLQCGAADEWNTISNHYATQSTQFQNLFSDLNAILDYAKSRNISENLQIIVMSERGRAPKLNAKQGKDPWPYTSVLLHGSLFAGGQVTGLTDNFLRGIAIDPIFGVRNNPKAVVISMSHIMNAIYYTTRVPYQLIVPKDEPLVNILRKE